MTTIAYRDGVMAADGKITANEVRYASMSKIERLPDGSLVGGCGCIVAVQKIFEALRHAASLGTELTHSLFAECKGGFALYVRKSDRAVFYIGGGKRGGYTKLDGKFFAEGSGYAVALAAMKAGATAKKAIEIACELDNNSGPPIQVEHLNEKSRSRAG